MSANIFSYFPKIVGKPHYAMFITQVKFVPVRLLRIKPLKFKGDPGGEGGVGLESNSQTSARLLREFFKWSVKQNSEDSVKIIMKRLFSMWVHPKESMRHAASTAFNQIYVAFRWNGHTVLPPYRNDSSSANNVNFKMNKYCFTKVTLRIGQCFFGASLVGLADSARHDCIKQILMY